MPARNTNSLFAKLLNKLQGKNLKIKRQTRGHDSPKYVDSLARFNKTERAPPLSQPHVYRIPFTSFTSAALLNTHIFFTPVYTQVHVSVT